MTFRLFEMSDMFHFKLVFEPLVVDMAILRINMATGQSMFQQTTITTFDNRPAMYSLIPKITSEVSFINSKRVMKPLLHMVYYRESSLGTMRSPNMSSLITFLHHSFLGHILQNWPRTLNNRLNRFCEYVLKIYISFSSYLDLIFSLVQELFQFCISSCPSSKTIVRTRHCPACSGLICISRK